MHKQTISNPHRLFHFAVEFENKKGDFCVTPMQAISSYACAKSFNLYGVGAFTAIRHISAEEYARLRMESERITQGGSRE